MTIKRKFAYYTIPVILVCISAFFILKAHYQNKDQESVKVYGHSTSEDTEVVQEKMQKQTEEHHEEITADTINESSEIEEVDDATKVATTDSDMQISTSNVTVVENTLDEDNQQETSTELPNSKVWDSETREIPNLSEIHLQRPHYTVVLDNGTVFDSRKSREASVPAGAVTSGSVEDVQKTIRQLEKRENKSPGLKAYIETLKRVRNP